MAVAGGFAGRAALVAWLAAAWLAAPLAAPVAADIRPTAPGTAAPLPAPLPAPLAVVPCRAGDERGCVEVLLDADDAAEFDGFAPCWTLPPYGDAGVAIAARLLPAAPDGRARLTRRLMIELAPLSAVPPGTVALRFGRADPTTGRLACALTVEVSRSAGALAAPATVALPERRVEAWHLWQDGPGGAPAIVRLGPAPGSMAVGPLRADAQAVLTGPGGNQGAARVDLAGEGRIRPGQTVTLTVTAHADLPLGALAGEVWLTAPQLVQPQRIALAGSARIGPWTILAVLALGVAGGWLSRRLVLPRQDLAQAVAEAEGVAAAVEAQAEAETDPDLREAVKTAIADFRSVLDGGADAAAVSAAATALRAGADRLLAGAVAQRAELAQALAPGLAAHLPPVEETELPQPALLAQRAMLREVQAMLSRRLVGAPDRAIRADLPALDASSRAALRSFCATTAALIDGLARWPDPEAVTALAALRTLAPAFDTQARAAEADAARILTDARRVWEDLAAAGAGVAVGLAPYLAKLQQGAASHAPPLDTRAETAAALDALAGRRPVAALTALAGLARRYADAAGDVPFAQAFAPVARGGVELGQDPQVLRTDGIVVPPVAPLPPAPRLVLPEGGAIAGRPVTVEIAGLLAGQVATLLTPVNALRISPEGPGSPVRLIFDSPGGQALTLAVEGPGDAGRRDHLLHLTVAPQAGQSRVLRARANRARADLRAAAAAAVLATGSGALVFAQVPLTAWGALAGPLLWGFLVDLNLRDWIGRLQAQRDALLPAQGGQARPG